jgi:antitoxin ParD1/3/4
MSARNVSLTERLASFVDQQVAAGRHQNASEVVREALRRYQEEIALSTVLQSIADAGWAAVAKGDVTSVPDRATADALREQLIAEAAVPDITPPGDR